MKFESSFINFLKKIHRIKIDTQHKINTSVKSTSFMFKVSKCLSKYKDNILRIYLVW
jgi:hypothetical protein